MAKKKEIQGTAVNLVHAPNASLKAAADDTPGQVPSVNFILTRPLNEVPTVYANQSAIRASIHDVQIIFSQVLNEQAGNVTAIPQVVVYMSPSHAKRISGILAAQIKQYEAAYGPVPDVPEIGASPPKN